LLGQLRQRLNDPVGAEQAFQTVLAAEPPVTAELRTDMQSRLADVLIEQQKYDPARQILDQLIQHHPGPAALPWLSQLSGVLYLQSKFAEASEVMERCVQLSDLCHGPDSPETAKHLDNLAGVRFLLGQYEAAEPVIQRAIQILEREVPVRSAALNRARENYSQLLRSTGRGLEADQLEGLVLAAQAAEEPPTLTGSHVLDDL
jgi:tetratricopeptide (TPR) repeat protein